MSNNIIRINPTALPNSREMGYSQISIVEPGRMAYISGQVAWQANGEAVPTNIIEQMEIVLKNALSALAAVNAKPEDVVIVRIYITDLTPERLEALMPAFLTAFDGAEPCVTGVQAVE